MFIIINRNEKLDNETDGIHMDRAYSVDNSGNRMMSDLAVFIIQKNESSSL